MERLKKHWSILIVSLILSVLVGYAFGFAKTEEEVPEGEVIELTGAKKSPVRFEGHAETSFLVLYRQPGAM